MWNFVVQVLVAVAISVVAYMIAPKPSTSNGRQSQDLREPQSDAGIPVPVIFGEVTIMSPNVMWYGDVEKHEYEVDA